MHGGLPVRKNPFPSGRISIMELRVPTLDNEMISMAHTIPGHAKIKRLPAKYLFKKAAAGHMPKQIVNKKKIGFLVPIEDWLRDKAGMGRYLDQLNDTANKIEGINKASWKK